jgi:hypothetical protein
MCPIQFLSYLILLDPPDGKLQIKVEKKWLENIFFFQAILNGINIRFLSMRTLLYVSFKLILISPVSFLDIPNSIRMLYNTSLLTES